MRLSWKKRGRGNTSKTSSWTYLRKGFGVISSNSTTVIRSTKKSAIFAFSPGRTSQRSPFSKLDLISCRNMLIYLGNILQKRVLPIFHYALKPSGFLFLGNSETVGSFSDIFLLLDKKKPHLFQKVFHGRSRARDGIRRLRQA